jgi:hypothetical protein
VIPTRIRMSPAANVAFPHQSIRAGVRTLRSSSFRYAHTVPKIPKGTDTRNTMCHWTGANSPPRTSPMKAPAMAATLLIPRPRPRWSAGNASVMMAEELAKSMAPPTPCPMRMAISQMAAPAPCIQVIESRIEKAVNTAKPRLYILTRPNMSPIRPSVTTMTARTTMKPMSIHNM